MQTLERTYPDRVRCEMDNAVAMVETKVHNTCLAAMDSLVLSRVELAIKSVNVSSVRDPGGAVLNPDQGDFLGNIEGRGQHN